MTSRALTVVVTAWLVGACGASPAEPSHPAMTPSPTAAAFRTDGHGRPDALGHAHPGHGDTKTAAADPVERALDEVAAVHGAPGPWAVAGYRMSAHALDKLGLKRGSFDLQIVHWTPREVRYSCIADGAAAQSGASLGKLNLSLVDATAENVLTVYRDKKTGKSIALRPTASFRQRYAETAPDQARVLGREVMNLPPEQVFEEVPVT